MTTLKPLKNLLQLLFFIMVVKQIPIIF